LVKPIEAHRAGERDVTKPLHNFQETDSTRLGGLPSSPARSAVGQLASNVARKDNGSSAPIVLKKSPNITERIDLKNIIALDR